MSIRAVTKEIKPGHVNPVKLGKAKINWLQTSCFWTKTGKTDAVVLYPARDTPYFTMFTVCLAF